MVTGSDWKTKKPKITGKVLKYFCIKNATWYKPIPFEENSNETITGTIFLFRFRLISLRRNFHIYDVSAKVKFKSKSCEYSAEVYYCSDVTVSGKAYELKQEDSVVLCPVLLKNEMKDLDIQLIVKCDCIDIEYIELLFKDYKKREQRLKFEQRDFENALNNI